MTSKDTSMRRPALVRVQAVVALEAAGGGGGSRFWHDVSVKGGGRRAASLRRRGFISRKGDLDSPTRIRILIPSAPSERPRLPCPRYRVRCPAAANNGWLQRLSLDVH
jgi:hypothetical protein